MARILLLEEEAIKKAADPASSTSTTASNQPQRNMTSNSSCSVRLFALGKIFSLLNQWKFYYFSATSISIEIKFAILHNLPTYFDLL